MGRQAAIEDTEKICDALEGADMVFITAGLGSGTGTGAAPVIASIASQLGGDAGDVLTVAVVTLPFTLEGKRRMAPGPRRARPSCASASTRVIAIPNDRLLQTVARNTPITDAFRVADDVLRQAVQGISDIITIPGLLNLDFNDVRAVMKGMGEAVMGTGIGEGDNRAVEAAQRAISNPLLEDTSIEGARGIIVNITGGADLSLSEATEAAGLHHQGGRPRGQRHVRRRDRRGDGRRGEGHGDRHRLQPAAGARSRDTPTDLTNYVGRTPIAGPAACQRGRRRARRLLSEDAGAAAAAARQAGAPTSTCRPSCASRAAGSRPGGAAVKQRRK